MSLLHPLADRYSAPLGVSTIDPRDDSAVVRIRERSLGNAVTSDRDLVGRPFLGTRGFAGFETDEADDHECAESTFESTQRLRASSNLGSADELFHVLAP